MRGLENLKELNLSCNPVGIEGYLNTLTLTNLEKLEMYNCKILMNEMPQIKNSAPVNYLNLSYNQISTDLPLYPELETLIYCGVKRIPDILNFPNLQVIDFKGHGMCVEELFDFILDVSECCPLLRSLMLAG
jgi:hypothetical protein